MFPLVRELLPFFALLYLLDALCLVGAGHLIFRGRGARGFELLGAGLKWLGWRPDGRAYSAQRLLAAPTPGSLYVAKKGQLDGVAPPDPESFHRLRYEELSMPEVEHHTVRFDRTRAVRLPSVAHADELAALVGELRGLDEEERRKRLLDERRAAGDLAALREHEAKLLELRRPLLLLCRILFAGTFAVLPAVAFFSDSPRLLGAALLLLGYGYVVLFVDAVAFVRRVRREKLARTRGVLLPVLLSPPAALRAPLNLTRDLCHRFDDLTLAAAFLPVPEFLRRAHSELHAASHALAQDAGDDWRWLFEGRRVDLVGLLEELGLSEAEALAPPRQVDPEALSYCPLCYGEYRQGGGDCEGCSVPLLPFGESAVASTESMA